jgi:hypothetical protein
MSGLKSVALLKRRIEIHRLMDNELDSSSQCHEVTMST